MVGIDLEAVVACDFRDHGTHGPVANLPFATTVTADEVVMRREAGDLVADFAIAGIGRDDDAEVHKKANCAINGRTIDRPVRLLDPREDLPEGRMPVSGADRLKNERALPGHAMTGRPERLLPAQLVVCHRQWLPADICDKPSRPSPIPRINDRGHDNVG